MPTEGKIKLIIETSGKSDEKKNQTTKTSAKKILQYRLQLKKKTGGKPEGW